MPLASRMSAQTTWGNNRIVNVNYRECFEYNVKEFADNIFHGLVSVSGILVPSSRLGPIEFSSERRESKPDFGSTQHPSTDIDGCYNASR